MTPLVVRRSLIGGWGELTLSTRAAHQSGIFAVLVVSGCMPLDRIKTKAKPHASTRRLMLEAESLTGV